MDWLLQDWEYTNDEIYAVERQKEIRKGVDNGNMVFNKSKSRLRPKLDEINKEQNL